METETSSSFILFPNALSHWMGHCIIDGPPPFFSNWVEEEGISILEYIPFREYRACFSVYSTVGGSLPAPTKVLIVRYQYAGKRRFAKVRIGSYVGKHKRKK